MKMRSTTQWPKILSILILGFLPMAFVGCAGKSAPVSADSASSEGGSEINELKGIEVEDRDAVLGIVVSGSQPMSPNIFKLTDPDRIIIDLPDTKLANVKGPIRVGKGGVREITLNQFDDAASSLSRIVVRLDQPAEYQVESEGIRLNININKEPGSMVEEAGLPEIPAVGEEVAEAFAQAPAEDLPLEPLETLQEPISEQPSAEETGGFDADAAFAAPDVDTESATRLVDVQYASSATGTIVTLVANAPVGEYEDFILEDPKRLVVDLKGLDNEYPAGDEVPMDTAELNKVRLGVSEEHTRVVFDLRMVETPAYTIKKEGNSLVVNVAAPTPAAPEASPFDVAAVEPELLGVEPLEPALEEPATALEAEPFEPEPEPAPVADLPEPGGPVLVTGLSFKQLPGERKSRLIIGLSDGGFEHSTTEEGPGRFRVEIGNSRLERRILKREFNTTEFRTAILSVTPVEDRAISTTSFIVELAQEVPYNVTRSDQSVHVDVTVPDQIYRKQTPTMAEAGSETPAPPEEEEAAEAVGGSVEEPGAAEPKMRQERLLMDEIRKEKAVDRRPKGYRYVKEGFMSDTAKVGQPLSQMGQILSGDVEGRVFTGRKISLDFKDAEIRSIFRLIADISKLNMIVSDEVKGRVTVRLDNVPWDQAFAIILQTKGLWFERYGNIIRLAPADKLRRERELAAAAQRAAKAAKPLDVLFKPVSYAQASALTRQVQTVLSDRGSVDVDSRTNTLIIRDIRENLEKARTLVDVLDAQTPQVSIEARIVEANTNYTRSFGIIWGGQGRFTPATGNPTGIYFPSSIGVTGGAGGLGTSFSGLPVAMNYPSPLGVNAGVGLRLGSINNIVDLDLALGILETQGNAKLISSPKITVLDNSSASISAGSKIPFLTQTANAGSNVRFESAATSLSVTPHITNDGSILMSITATRNEPNFAQLVQGNPLVDQRTATTEVLVRSGNTTVLGGIYSIRTGTTKDSLPYLSSIPIIGWLFRNYAKELRRTELLIFVTPRIVGDEREAVRDVRG